MDTSTSGQSDMRSTDADDKSRSFFRSQERLFCFNGQWFFATREGDCGPFPTKEIARAEVTRYIAEKAALIDFQNSREEAPEPPRRKAEGALDLALIPFE